MDAARAPWSLAPAVPGDLEEVMRLERAGFSPGIVEEAPVFRQRLEAFANGFFLLRQGPRTVGYACTEIWKDRQDYLTERFRLGHPLTGWHDSAGDECYLASMTVEPAARRSGAGRFLFRETLLAMRSAFPALRRGILLVNEGWTGACRIYRDEGFVVACRMPGFFRPEGFPPQAGLVMEKEF